MISAKHVTQERIKDNLIEYVERNNIGNINIQKMSDTIQLVNLNDKRLLMFSLEDDSIDLMNKHNIVSVLVSSLHYIHDSLSTCSHVPSAVVFTSDYNSGQVFILSLKPFYHYVEDSVTFEDSNLYDVLIKDKNIRPYVHVNVLTDDFPSIPFMENLVNVVLLDSIVKTVVDVKSLEKVFYDFSIGVLGGTASDLDNKKQIDVFIKLLKGNGGFYLHPSNIDTLVMGKKSYKIASSFGFELFVLSHDVNSYTVDDLNAITSIADVLITESDRRLTGDFWTPKIWVDRAHETISDALGDNWREDYTVWDCAAGVLNLTKDYDFSNLYSSTLFSEELDIAEDYNKDSVKFQYDFLNDDIDLHFLSRADFTEDDSLFSSFKLPEKLLRDMYDNKPIVFFSNPPYGKATTKEGSSKVGVNVTFIQERMKQIGGYSHATHELYTQFVFRVQQFAKIFDYKNDFHFFFFFNKGFLLSPAYGKFMDDLLNQFTYKNGFMLNAGEFGGTSALWGIIFAHFELDIKKENSPRQDKFLFTVEKTVKTVNGTRIEKTGEWNGIRVEKGKKLSTWFKEIPVSDSLSSNMPITKSGFDAPTSRYVAKPREKTIGYALVSGDDVQSFAKYIGLYTMTIARGGGRSVTEDNFLRATTTFSIRRAVQRDLEQHKQLWIKDKDIFKYPDNSILTPEFHIDCLTYALFDKQSRQTSLRNFSNNENSFNVYNEFFPFSRNFMKGLAEKHFNEHMIKDVHSDIENIDNNVFMVGTGHNERLAYRKFKEHEDSVSSESKAILSLYEELIVDSFAMRESFFELAPRYEINNWDVGWLQFYRMVFNSERLNDDFLPVKDKWDGLIQSLRKKIVTSVYDSGMIPGPLTIKSFK